jgi:hypothetical protein
MATEPDFACVGLDGAGENTKQGGLATAHFIVQCDASCIGAVTQPLKEDVVAVAFAEILELKHGVQCVSEEVRLRET